MDWVHIAEKAFTNVSWVGITVPINGFGLVRQTANAAKRTSRALRPGNAFTGFWLDRLMTYHPHV